MDKVDKIFYTIMATLMLLVIGSGIQYFLSVEEEVITGEVISSEFHRDYMTITFDNGETYNIEYKDIDFTVNSKMNIKLTKGSLWFMPNTNNVWDVITIVKVPDVGDE